MGTALEPVLTYLFKYPPRLFSRGDLSVAPVVPAALLVLAALVAVALTALAHRRLQGVERRERVVLGALRTLAIVTVMALLLRPTLVLSAAVPQRNVIALLLDDSRSMRLDDGQGRTRLAAMTRTFADTSALVRRLSEQFAVRVFRFAADAAPLAAGSALTANGGRTDVAAALDAVRGEVAGMPLAGMIVVTDGADNGSTSLAAALTALRARRVPVHTVGVGEERFARDLSVVRVTVPERVLAGSTVLLDVALGLRGVGGEQATVVAEVDGRIVATETMVLPSRGDVARLQLRVPPAAAGSHALTVRARPLPRERVTENNAYDGALDVRAGPARILYMEGEPRPELAFLRRAVVADSGIQVAAVVRTAEKKYLRLGVRDSLELVGGFPTRREELFRFQAVILGSIEASFFTAEQLRMLADFVSVRGGTLLALGGRAALAEGGFAGTPIAEALPVLLAQRADTGQATMVAVRPTSAGHTHAALQLGATAAASRARWDSLPALTMVNRVGALRPGATALLAGETEGTRDVPVLAYQRYGRGMGVVFAAQDSWLWKMHASVKLGDATHATFWRQLLRWTVADVPDQIAIAALPARVNPEEPVMLRATVTDSAFAPATAATVMARVTTPLGEHVDVPMERSLRDPGTFTARFVPPVRGAYALTVLGGTGRDTARSAAAALLADDRGADVEQAELRAPLLRQIATETGGRYYPIAEAERLVDEVGLTESGITQREARDLWDMPIVFFLLVALLGGEWLLRRRQGLA